MSWEDPGANPPRRLPLCASLLSSKPSMRWWCWCVIREPFLGLNSKVFQQLLEVLKQKALLMSHTLLQFHQHVKNPPKSNSVFLMLKGALWIAPFISDSKYCFSPAKRKLSKKFIVTHSIFIFNHKDGEYCVPKLAAWARLWFHTTW